MAGASLHTVAGFGSSRARDKMIDRLRQNGITDEVVLTAMTAVPRHLFLDDALSSRAYEEASLPIGHGQTISQPMIVAKMTQVLQQHPALNKVLEVGTGCGYQTAVLSQLAKTVYSIERIRPLVMKARGFLQMLKCTNVKLGHKDGFKGLPEYALFDGIIVTAAASHIPQDLLDQLAIGGRLVIPVGVNEQTLTLVERRSETQYHQTTLQSVKFVPLVPKTA